MSVRILDGDALTVLRTLPDQSVQCCVTSPPYFGLRDYGVSGQLGLEKTPQLYIDAMVGVFSEVKRVLRDDGTLWLNMGDSYTDGGRGSDAGSTLGGRRNNQRESRVPGTRENTNTGLRPKNLLGMPWRLAFGLQNDAWYLRCDIVWSKPNPMPESVVDRPTRAHEYVFLLSKSRKYFYDADAIRTPLQPKTLTTFGTEHRAQGNDALGSVKSDNWGRSVKVRKPRLTDKQRGHGRRHAGFNDRWDAMSKEEQQFAGANARSVWTVATHPYSGAHFATFPPDLIEPCILAGSAKGDTVLDPFMGAGTTGLVADRLGRNAIGIELNPKYAEMARKRITDDSPLFGDVA